MCWINLFFVVRSVGTAQFATKVVSSTLAIVLLSNLAIPRRETMALMAAFILLDLGNVVMHYPVRQHIGFMILFVIQRAFIFGVCYHTYTTERFFPLEIYPFLIPEISVLITNQLKANHPLLIMSFFVARFVVFNILALAFIRTPVLTLAAASSVLVHIVIGVVLCKGLHEDRPIDH